MTAHAMRARHRRRRARGRTVPPFAHISEAMRQVAEAMRRAGIVFAEWQIRMITEIRKAQLDRTPIYVNIPRRPARSLIENLIDPQFRRERIGIRPDLVIFDEHQRLQEPTA